MYQQELYKLAVSFIKGIGDKNVKRLISMFNTPEDIFNCSLNDLKNVLNNSRVNTKTVFNSLKYALDRAEIELRYIYSNDINYTTLFDDDYPQRLLNCSDSPFALYYSGQNTFNAEKIIAIVGTRDATAYGKDFCKSLIEDLASRYPDAVVVSGLAYGIDVTAHNEALKNNLKTWAVLGHSLELIYPASHKGVAEKIIKSGGAVLTDYPSASIIDPSNFVKRNRIVAGMCDGLIIVESGPKGGAMITANIANHYNKDVFALPGNVNSKFSKGCNQLIKTNRSNLIESIEDLEYIMNWKSTNCDCKQGKLDVEIEMSTDEKSIVKILSNYDFLDIDNLIRQSDLDSNIISLVLLQLEMKGVLRALPGKIFTLKKK